MELIEADDYFGKFQALHSRTFTSATLRRVYLAESFAEEKNLTFILKQSYLFVF